MEAIMVNLISNAVTHAKTKGAISFALEQEKGGIVLTLANTNDGLVKEDLEHLFEPFWRKEESRSDQSHCGIGLPLVSAYAKLMHIEIVADLHTPDKFTIKLHIPI